MIHKLPKKRGSNRENKNIYPPHDGCSVQEWIRRTQSPIYRKKIKRSIQGLQMYFLLNRGTTHVTRKQKDALHWFADPFTNEDLRRMARDKNENENALLTDSLKY